MLMSYIYMYIHIKVCEHIYICIYTERERDRAHVWSHDCKFSEYNELEELHNSHEKLHRLAALPDLYANFTRPYKFTHTLWRVGNVQRFQVQRCV